MQRLRHKEMILTRKFSRSKILSAVLDFLASTEAWRRLPVRGDVRSEVSERQARVRREIKERRVLAAKLGAGGDKEPQFLDTPSLQVSADGR